MRNNQARRGLGRPIMFSRDGDWLDTSSSHRGAAEEVAEDGGRRVVQRLKTADVVPLFHDQPGESLIESTRLTSAHEEVSLCNHALVGLLHLDGDDLRHLKQPSSQLTQ